MENNKKEKVATTLKSSKIAKIKKQNILSIFFMAIVLVGSLGVGVGLLLSEILYPQIEELFACPAWYQAFLYSSVAVAVIGLVGCGFTKNCQNTSKLEWRIELSLFLAGLTIEIICALARTQSYVLDIFICIGGAISSVGFFCGIGSLIGRLKKTKLFYSNIYSYLITDGTLSYENFPKNKPASLVEIMEVEKYFGTPLPNELVDFLLEFNGDVALLFSASEIVSTTKLVRKAFKDTTYDGLDKFCFFGADKVGEKGDLFCYKILADGSINDGEIYLWKHKTNQAKLVAKTLPELIKKYYNNKID